MVFKEQDSIVTAETSHVCLGFLQKVLEAKREVSLRLNQLENVLYKMRPTYRVWWVCLIV